VATKIEKKFVILDEEESANMNFTNIISICTGEISLYVIICIITCLGKYDLRLLMFEKKNEIVNNQLEMKTQKKKVEENITKIYFPIKNIELGEKRKEIKLKKDVTTASIYFKVSLYRCFFIIQNYRFLQTTNSILMLIPPARLTYSMFLIKPCSIHINMMPPPT
jgi:hypothetical protein